jgi:hypothetical protein
MGLALASSAMIYRKQPPTPPRLLLRIMGAAGAGTLLGMAGCSSNSGPEGLAPMMTDSGTSSDGASDSAVAILEGSVACPPDASDVVGCPGSFPADASDDATDHIINGVVACPSDASGIQGCPVVTGLSPAPTDASDDVMFNGLVVHPGDSG